MYLIEPFFKLTALENDIGQQSRLLNAVTDQWRYNGQIIGREIPLYLTEEDGEQGFAMRVICPEQDSLLPENNNQTVNLAMENAEKCGLKFQGFQIIADDLNADGTAECSQPAWQIRTAPQNVANQHGKCSTPHICNPARHCIAEEIFLQFRSINN